MTVYLPTICHVTLSLSRCARDLLSQRRAVMHRLIANDRKRQGRSERIAVVVPDLDAECVDVKHVQRESDVRIIVL